MLFYLALTRPHFFWQSLFLVGLLEGILFFSVKETLGRSTRLHMMAWQARVNINSSYISYVLSSVSFKWIDVLWQKS